MRVAILGAGGIGSVHARIFQDLGADVCAVLGSSEDTAGAAAATLANSLGIQARPFSSLDRLLAESVDAVSICTPAHLHLNQILACFDRGLPVFCEKPLIWEDNIRREKLFAQLDVLASHPNSRFSVNTSNALFMDAARTRIPAQAEVRRFFFRFHTRGTYRGMGIAVDLMPHGLSLLLRLFGRQDLSAFHSSSTETHYRCNFVYGGCQVEFDFAQGHGGAPDLFFSANEREFQRVQQGLGETYAVHLLDVSAQELIPVEDPFKTYIAAFIRRCQDQTNSWLDWRSEAIENLRLMAVTLLS